MLGKLAIVGILAIFLTGCGGGDDAMPWEKKGNEATAGATAAATTASNDDTESTAVPTRESKSGETKSAVESLKTLSSSMFSGGSLNLSGEAVEVDPALTAALLTQEDVPTGFIGLGQDFNFASDSPEGKMEVSMRMYAQGDVMSGEAGSILVSAAMSIASGSVDDFETALADLKEQDLTADDLKEMAGELGGEGEGVQITEFEMLKTSGLGDNSLGMHMVMDASAMAAEGTEGLDAFKNGMAIDMYVFMKGERGYLLVNVLPADQPAGIDGLDLAKTMYSRAE
jgi:hypothetical protein